MHEQVETPQIQAKNNYKRNKGIKKYVTSGKRGKMSRQTPTK